MHGGRRWRRWAVFLLLAGCLAVLRGLPVVRWFFRQRAERVVEEAGRRGIELPTFKLTRRGALIRRLTSDPEVRAAAGAYARERGVSMAVAMARVERYAREIVPSFNAFLYFRIGIPLARRISRALYDVRVVSGEGLDAVEKHRDAGASIVFVMNHRSNMDYVILAYLTSDRVALSYAAGEWACVWPLGRLIGAMGAFFVRRGSGDELYRRVLERFVQMAVEGGLTQVVFPEGGLSRNGKMREPKIGLLDYMLRRFDPNEKDLVFVPVAVNYDWVLEDHSLVQPGGPKAGLRGLGGIFASTAASVARNLLHAPPGPGRLGRAAVSFGAPVSTREYTRSLNVDFRTLEREVRAGQVETFARTLMQAIAGNLPGVPVPAIARVLVEAEQSLTESELLSRARMHGFEETDAEAALRSLELRRLVKREGDHYRVVSGGGRLLAYYANSASSG